MHEQSIRLMQDFVARYAGAVLEQHAGRPSVADVGSLDVNGTFRPMLEGFAYTGLDIAAGPNVDRVVDLYDYGPEQYDVVISGSTMEHVEDLHAWAGEVMGICKAGGLVCIIAPHTCPEHHYPIDCWRVFPHGMRWLFRELEILECRADELDTVLIARKPVLSLKP